MFFQKSPLISWVPPTEVFLASWGVAMLLQKRWLRRQQEKALDNAVLLELPDHITVEEASSLIQKLQESFPQWRRSFLLHRVSRLLSHFQHTGDRSEVTALLASQSEIDGTALRSSYTMLRVFVWAIPILGFIGTVIGLQEAISGFAGLKDIERLQEQMALITAGLGGAFQATLIALAFSLLIMFPTSASERAEWRLLNHVDDFCNEQILRRLSLPHSSGNPEDLKALATEMGVRFATAIQELFAKERIVGLVLEVYGEVLAKAAEAIREKLDSTHKLRIAELQALRDEIQTGTNHQTEAAVRTQELVKAINSAAERIHDLPRALAAPLDDSLSRASVQFKERVDTLLHATGEATNATVRASTQLSTTVDQLTAQVHAIGESTATAEASLSLSVHELGESAERFARSLESAQVTMGGMIGESQVALREGAASLRVAADALYQLVKTVDARRELETLQAALDRVSHLLQNSSDGNSGTTAEAANLPLL
jgi:biopolymer transport protein ExbB/TolQ